MKVAIWDTYVQKQNNGTMHFDIIVPDTTTEAVVYGFGNKYLLQKGEGGQQLSASECKLCHMESATPVIAASIKEKGYYILEMEGCE